MPLTDINFAPGLVKDDTALTAKGGYVAAGNMRFRQGKPETRGGWELASLTPFVGIVRGQKAWTDLLGQPQMVIGTADKAYAFTGGALVDITPPYAEGAALNPFKTTSGSSTVVVNITESGIKPGQTITFSNGTAVGGLTLNGSYIATRLVTRDSFEINAGSSATSTGTGGAGVDFVIAWQAGLVDAGGGIGYGTGGYSLGPFGLPSTDFMPAAWSFDNFGETLLATRRGGALYAWQPAIAYSETMQDNKYVGGSGWAPSATGGTKTSGTAANLSQNIQNVTDGGRVYRLRFTASVSAGTFKAQINAGTPTPAVIDVGSASTAISRSGTYSRLIVMPANPSDLVFAADGAFAGSITGVSLKLEDKLFIVPEAPRRIDSMFVDPHRTVKLFGTYEADGDYNPLLDRWSDLENYRTWIPDTNNFAGEIALSNGGRIVRAIASRNANLIWTDTALFSEQFTPDGFNLALVATGVGALGINAVVEHQGVAYWWSNNGNPYRTTFDFQGTVPQMIDCRIRADVFNHIAPSQGEKVYASVNTEFSEIQWFYPDSRIGLECNTAAVYQFAENHWTQWAEARSSWVPAGVFVKPIACGTDGYLYYHERGDTANGNPLPSFIETAFFDIEGGGNLMEASRFVPDFQGQGGSIDIAFTGKLWPNAAETITRVRTLERNRNKADFRLKARQMKFRLDASTPWRGGAWRLEAKKSGARR